MNISALIAVASCLCLTSGLGIRPKRNQAVSHFIDYIGRDGNSGNVQENITILGQEVKVDTQNGMMAVLDYSQMLLFVKRTGNNDVCMVTSFKDLKQVPSLKMITKMVDNYRRPLKFPSAALRLSLVESENQERPELSPLSEELCGDSKITVFKHKTDKVTSQTSNTEVSLYHRLRPKREIGWGEVLLIVVIIILL